MARTRSSCLKNPKTRPARTATRTSQSAIGLSAKVMSLLRLGLLGLESRDGAPQHLDPSLVVDSYVEGVRLHLDDRREDAWVQDDLVARLESLRQGLELSLLHRHRADEDEIEDKKDEDDRDEIDDVSGRCGSREDAFEHTLPRGGGSGKPRDPPSTLNSSGAGSRLLARRGFYFRRRELPEHLHPEDFKLTRTDSLPDLF